MKGPVNCKLRLLAVTVTEVFGIAKALEIDAGYSRHQHVSVPQPFRGLLV